MQNNEQNETNYLDSSWSFLYNNIYNIRVEELFMILNNIEEGAYEYGNTQIKYIPIL